MKKIDLKRISCRRGRAAAVVTLLLMLFATPSFAQGDAGVTKAETGVTGATKQCAFLDRLMGDVIIGTGTKSHGMQLIEPTVNLGYRFVPRAYAFVHAAGQYAIYDKVDGVRPSTRSYLIGGGLGYTVFKDSPYTLDLRGVVSTSYGNSDWKQTTYDLGIQMNVKYLGVGLAYRHISSRTAGIKGYNGLFATLGFSF